MSKPAVRRQIFVNRPIQGALISRVALYWLLGMFIQALLIMLLSVGTGSSDELGQRTMQFWWHMKLILVSSLLTLPLLVLDIIKLSHRWVGPIYRLRSGLQALAMGEPVKPITYYIDPATPEKWRKYVKLGVEDWKPAFEAADTRRPRPGVRRPVSASESHPPDRPDVPEQTAGVRRRPHLLHPSLT